MARLAITPDDSVPARRRKPLDPAPIDYVLASASVALLAVVAVALLRGQAEWTKLPVVIWAHLGTIAIALALTPVMLTRPRGDRWHRTLGYVWLGAMAATSIASFGIRMMNDGKLGPIHILSALTLIGCARVIMTARGHQHVEHRRTIRLIVGGALLLAGFFTFQFDRLLGQWLVGVAAIGQAGDGI